MFHGALKSSELHGLPHEVMDGAELQRRFPGYRLPRELRRLYEPEGGFLLPERCDVAHVVQAMSHGAEVRCRGRCWNGAGGGRAWVRTSRGRYEAGRLIVCAGPWAAKLVPELAGLAVPERQVLAWLQPSRPDGSFPALSRLQPGGGGGSLLRLPELPHSRLQVREVPPPRGNGGSRCGESRARAQGRGAASSVRRRYFPDGAGPTLMLKACLFTNSPDRHFILDRHPAYPEVVVAPGFPVMATSSAASSAR